MAAKGIKVKPEIMVPLVGHINEFKLQEKIIRNVADSVIKEKGKKVKYFVGTMIELPRAAVTADRMILHRLLSDYQEMMPENSFHFMFRKIFLSMILLK